MKKCTLILMACMGLHFANAQVVTPAADDMYRPNIHFTPKAHWMNDPNGMVYYKGIYHLFFQYHPGGNVWGPMHWGHATSTNMFNWQEQPVALYPDSIGTIFSGSIVIDKLNTSGLGKNGIVPLIAIFTHFNAAGEKAGTSTFQNQSIAYSLDDGFTWTKYAGNPVLPNPGIADFRDPKVSWYAPAKQWVMTLAVKDHISFYTSKNLINWQKASDFGNTVGAHGGVWECPDLIEFTNNGKPVWALLVSINPGGPNGGSATQYFTGNFNGTTFTATDTVTRWLDYGPDNYAGVTWYNTGKRKLFLGWMSNWLYAQDVPTQTWRSAMTVPRELQFIQTQNGGRLTSLPVTEMNALHRQKITRKNVMISAPLVLQKDTRTASQISLSINAAAPFSFTIKNNNNELVLLQYAPGKGFTIDRSKSGNINFAKNYPLITTAPRLGTGQIMDVTLVLDATSIEVFADGGLTAMTAIYFPQQPFTHVQFATPTPTRLNKLTYYALQ